MKVGLKCGVEKLIERFCFPLYRGFSITPRFLFIEWKRHLDFC